MNNHVVIMAGGIGSRFWPLSTPEYPKQFIDVLGCGRTLIQLTYDRFQGIVPNENVWVVTNAKYVDIVKEQLPNIPAENILAEPCARNTAPCIAWSGWKIKSKDTDANIVVTPSDAVVMNPTEFQRIIKEALSYTAEHDAIVTLGIKPNRPETGYGYVHFADTVDGEIRKVAAFKEKPNLETAKEYLDNGNYLWNAGIFVWNVNILVKGISEFAPQIAGQLNTLSKYFDTAEEAAKTEDIFPTCEKISIDFAVMEKHPNVYTIPSEFGWSDLGNWQSLHEKLEKDINNNAIVGNIQMYDSKNCVVHAEDAKKVVIQGLDGFIFSEKNGQILVCKRSEEQLIKDWSTK